MTDKMTLDVLVGFVEAPNFVEPSFGVSLLASQFRDSFFETQTEIAGPSLALVTRENPPSSLVSEDMPIPDDLVGDDAHFLVTILVSNECAPESKILLQNIWTQVAKETPDYIGGVLTLEGISVKAKKSALFQMLRTQPSWEQYRIHPFSRDVEGIPQPIDIPIVDDNDKGPIDLHSLIQGLYKD